MHSCDVIVIDVSKQKAGTGWELEQLRLRNLRYKCLFVTGEEFLADAGVALDTHFANEDSPFVHLYGKSGKLAEPRPFEEHLRSIIEPAIAAWNRGGR